MFNSQGVQYLNTVFVAQQFYNSNKGAVDNYIGKGNLTLKVVDDATYAEICEYKRNGKLHPALTA